MIQRKLSKAQGYTIQVLATQLTQAQLEAASAQEALNEQAELLRISFGLPEGEAQFGQNPDGWTLVVTPTPEPKMPEPKMPEVPVLAIDDEGDVIEPIRAGKPPGPEETKAADDED